MPSCASLITSFTTRRPRRVSLRWNSVQIGSASEVPISRPRTSRRPSVFTPMAMITATETIRPPRRTFRQVASIQRQGRQRIAAATLVWCSQRSKHRR